MTDRSQNRKQWRRWRSKSVRSPRNRRRASPLQVALRALLIALVAPCLWTLFHSPRLTLKRVEVIGANRLGAERVLDLADLPLGRNIFCVNLYRARVRVEADPLVASAEVSRALPNAVRIFVRERHPVFVVAYAGKLFEADGEGVLFRQVLKPTPRLPVLALRQIGPLAVGQRVRADVLKPALTCLRFTAAERLLLWKINVDGPHDLCLNMKVPSHSSPAGKSLFIRLGRSEDLSLKLADVSKVLASRPQMVEQAKYLDVSCAGSPVYMAQTPAGAAAGLAPGNNGGLVQP